MNVILLAILAINVIIAVVSVIILINSSSSKKDVNGSMMSGLDMMSRILRENQEAAFSVQQEKLDEISRSMKNMAENNQRQLDNIRSTVDEKLQKTLNDRISQSFRVVSERLEQVYKGLGEMQSLATGVGDLKKVLSNVKTRGILGEIQLGAILDEILSKEQYLENTVTKPGSSERVEYAVKMPGSDGKPILLPIDAKFPADAYTAYLSACDSGDRQQIESCRKILETAVKKAAKDIHDKYVCPPFTTDFAIMFLPFEGLYSHIVESGMVEKLQREYRINIAGPTTMAALLNSLQMGFKTLAIQKRSKEVWDILAAAKVEFQKFDDVIRKTQYRINQANEELDRLVGVRTRSINRTLKSISEYREEDIREIDFDRE